MAAAKQTRSSRACRRSLFLSLRAEGRGGIFAFIVNRASIRRDALSGVGNYRAKRSTRLERVSRRRVRTSSNVFRSSGEQWIPRAAVFFEAEIEISVGSFFPWKKIGAEPVERFVRSTMRAERARRKRSRGRAGVIERINLNYSSRRRWRGAISSRCDRFAAGCIELASRRICPVESRRLITRRCEGPP